MSIDINNTQVVAIDDTHINVLTVGLTGSGGGGGGITTSGTALLKGNGAGGLCNSKLTVTEPATGATLTIQDGYTLSVSGNATVSGTNTGDQTSVTGNAGTATALQTARAINGVAFDGSADITVAADAATLTGSALASGVTSSSLTSLGTVSALTTTGNATLCGSGTDTLTINAGAWALPNAVTWTTTAASSTAETLCKWSVSDDSGSALQLTNGSATNALFIPTLEGVQSGTNTALNLYGSATTDTGSNPVISITGRTTAAGSIATRPLLDIKNNTTSVLQITGGNNLKITGSSTSPTLAGASADTVYVAAIDKSAAHRRLYIQSEAGSAINLGDDTLEFAASSGIVSSASTLRLDKYTGVNTNGVSTQAITASLGTSTDKGLVVKGAASQSGNLAEFQNSSGTPFFTIGPDTISGNSNLNNFLNLTCTMPSTMTTVTNAVTFVITGAGSSAQTNQAIFVQYAAGYTGPSGSYTMQLQNNNNSTGASYGGAGAFTSYRPVNANYAAAFQVSNSTSGMNVGFRSQVDGSSVVNYGLWSSASSSNNSPAKNVGVVGIALNATVNTAGFFGLFDGGTSAPTLSNAALIADNGATTGDIFVARDNGTAAVTIADGGDLIEQCYTRVASDFSVTSSTTLTNITGLTYNVQAGATYQLRALLFTTSNSAGGVKAAIGGTATATSIVYEGFTYNATTLSAQTRASALATAVGAVTSVTAASIEIEGTITVNASGTLTVQFAQNASSGSASTVLRGSTFTLKRIS